MAIRMMTTADHAQDVNVEIVRNYPGHEEGRVQHDSKCPHAHNHNDLSGVLSPECLQSYVKDGGMCSILGPLYMQTTHVGLVLSLSEDNGRDDSDFYAIVWNPVERKTERIQYASTRGWTYPNSAWEDATPEVLADVEVYQRERKEAAIQLQRERDAQVPMIDRRVRVIRGTKIPHGTEGTVMYFGGDMFYRASRYSANSRAIRQSHDMNDLLFRVQNGEMRVGIKLVDDSIVWTNAKNVTVI